MFRFTSLVLVLSLSACAPTQYAARVDASHSFATAELSPRSKSDVKGSLDFIEEADQLHISGVIRNLEPGAHGFHIHETGDCSASDASSAGGHFALKNQVHGPKDMDGSHAGDLGNIIANEKGVATVSIKSEDLCLDTARKCSILSRAVIVHAKRDDLKSQPSGAAGERVGCGVIRSR